MSELTFEELAAAAERDPANADFAVLRAAYIASEAYQPTNHFSQHKLRGSTNKAQGFEDIVVFCRKLLEDNPMDLEARLLLEFAYDQLEQHDLAVKEHAFVSGMLDAIWDSGDGKSFETAWHVVSVAEEYTLLSIMGLEMQTQELFDHEGRWYDVLTCASPKQPDAGPVKLYFDITDPFNHLNEMLR
jgi:hypothetical protein